MLVHTVPIFKCTDVTQPEFDEKLFYLQCSYIELQKNQQRSARMDAVKYLEAKKMLEHFTYNGRKSF